MSHSTGRRLFRSLMSSRLPVGWSVCLALVAGVVMTAAKPAAAQQPHPKRPVVLRFERHVLDQAFRAEGVAVGDFNHDGKADIAAGYVWYEAPKWKLHCVLEKVPEYQPKGYSNAFCTFVRDLNHDGWDDLIVVDFPGTPTWWFENPRGGDGPWKKHVLTPVTNNESPQFADVDGDGQREFLLAFSPDPEKPDGPERRMAWAEPDSDPTSPWRLFPISQPAAPGTRKYSHGLGCGDINGDGRPDIVVARGWYEAPADPKTGPWRFHPAGFGDKFAHMFVFDIDGDGDADVLGSSPHAYGIWWFEQRPDEEWVRHEIDRSFSQTHAICCVDLNGDGLPDFVTGKRWWAHGGRDPGGNEPAVLCWYELRRQNGRVQWVRHQIDHNSGIGTQFEVADVDGDGLYDIVTSNKRGVFYFRQVRD